MLETRQRFADRGATEAKRLSELGLVERIAGFESEPDYLALDVKVGSINCGPGAYATSEDSSLPNSWHFSVPDLPGCQEPSPPSKAETTQNIGPCIQEEYELYEWAIRGGQRYSFM